MRPPSLRTWPLPVVVSEEAYQEFTAGTNPVRRVMTEDPIRLDADHRGQAATENVDYVATQTGMTCDAIQPTVIRLELAAAEQEIRQ